MTLMAFLYQLSIKNYVFYAENVFLHALCVILYLITITILNVMPQWRRMKN